METTTEETTAEKQTRVIAQARVLHEPEKVTQGKIPRWLSKRITAYWKKKGQKRPSTFSLRETVIDIARNIGIEMQGLGILDHWGSTIGGRYQCCDDANECFVSEPYGFCMDYAKILDAIGSTLDVVWHISSNSWHFPGKTIRIIIHEPTPNL